MSSQVILKVVIDKKGKRILYGEADKNFMDVLLSLLSLSIGAVIKLLPTKGFVGPLGNLYRSVDNLSSTCFEGYQIRDSLLRPKVPFTKSQYGDDVQMEFYSAPKSHYRCSGANCGKYFTATYNAKCPGCRASMSSTAEYVYGAGEAKPNEGGYMKGVATYMVMDDLTVKPLSSMSTISVLKQFNVEDVGQIEEKIIRLCLFQVVHLLEVSLHSTTVLNDVFHYIIK